MSEALRAWLKGRTPPPPFDLAPWLEGADGDGVDALSALGGRALDRARSAPGRVRESALHLLAADALITYACEAALEQPEPEDALVQVLRGVADR